MNQDTRKDPRAKVLTMTVRYKSATLDEFIEHHSYDVSRGGMFIKTPSPFPPGTLLKFEVKIADEQRLMQGVGRVVWKREASDGDNADKPAGMGVKFIKIDDESRRTIDRLVEARAEGDNAFDQGSSQGSAASRMPAATHTFASATASAAVKPAADAPVRSRKSTVIGLGAMKPSGGATRPVISSGPPKQAPAAPEKPAPEAFFPKSDSRAEMPPVEDQTMMKQAKELLADALRYAGGSAEDVKAAAKVSSIPPHVPRPEPHRSVAPRPSKRAESESEPATKVPRAPIAEHVGEEGEAATTIWRANEAAALLAESMKDSVPPEGGPEIHGRITARPPAEAATEEFGESEAATVPGTSPDSESAKPAAKVVVPADEEPARDREAKAAKTSEKPGEVEPRKETPSKELSGKAAAEKAEKAEADRAEKTEKRKVATAVAVGERPSSRSRASQAMKEAAEESAEASGGGKGVFALVALAAAAGIAFYLTRPAPPPPPELPSPPEPARVEPPQEVTPSPPAAEVPAQPAAPAESAAPPASAAAEPTPPVAPSAAAPEAVQKPAEEKPVPRKVVPRRVPRKKVEPPKDAPEAPAETSPPTPPVEAAPEEPPPPPPPAASPAPATPPAPTPPPLGDNPY